MPIPKDARLLRLGVLGAGPIAQFAHFESAAKGRNTQLFAICDLAEDLARRMAATHAPDARIFTDYAAMLADPEVEAVVIATADAFHVPAALEALAAGKPVFVEKPVGVSVEEAEALAAAQVRTGLVVQIGHMKRFDPGLQSAKAFVDGEMGAMLALKAWYCDSTHRYTMTDAVQPLPVSAAGVKRPPGDPKADRERYFMLAHGSHLVDTARWLAGPIMAVDARRLERFGAHCWFVAVEFASGALGHLDLTIAIRDDWREGVTIYGEHGSVNARTFNPWYYRASDVEIFHERDATTRRVLGADGHFYRRQLEAFAEAVLRGGSVTGADAADGVASLRAMVAIRESARSGRPVRLDAVSGPV
jgi:predicted dehydrogenase